MWPKIKQKLAFTIWWSIVLGAIALFLFLVATGLDACYIERKEKFLAGFEVVIFTISITLGCVFLCAIMDWAFKNKR